MPTDTIINVLNETLAAHDQHDQPFDLTVMSGKIWFHIGLSFQATPVVRPDESDKIVDPYRWIPEHITSKELESEIEELISDELWHMLRRYYATGSDANLYFENPSGREHTLTITWNFRDHGPMSDGTIVWKHQEGNND